MLLVLLSFKDFAFLFSSTENFQASGAHNEYECLGGILKVKRKKLTIFLKKIFLPIQALA